MKHREITQFLELSFYESTLLFPYNYSILDKSQLTDSS